MVTEEIVDQALVIVARGGGNYEFFFSNLTSPDWIAPLKKRERFSHPPAAIREKESTRFPGWPEGEYLVRMAPIAPQAVFDALEPVAYQSDNHYVHQILLEIAAELPVHLTSEVAIPESKWASEQKRFLGLYESKLAPVLLRLIAGARSSIALMLLKPLLSVDSAPQREPIVMEGGISVRRSGSPVGRIDPWNIQRLLLQVSKPMVNAAPEGFLNLLSEKLNDAVSIYVNERGNGNDFSLIWRPRIDSGRFSDLIDTLVSAVRDASVHIAESGGYELITRILDKYEWPIFQRLKYYALGRGENLPSSLLNEVVLRNNLYEDHSANPEFNELLSKIASRLPEQTQQTLLAIVDAGPDLSEYSQYLATQGDNRDNAQQRLLDEWRLGWLTTLKDIAGDRRLNELEGLLAKYGPPKPVFSVGSARYVGHSSAINQEELKKFSISELLEYLKKWSPGARNHPEMPSRAGLGQELQTWVSEDPKLFADNLESFHLLDLHPTYLRSILDAFVTALKSDREFDTYKVSATIQWLLENTRKTGSEGFEWEEDPGWSWAHMSSARFLSELFLHFERLDTSRHRQFWPALSLIANNPSPSDEDEAEYRKQAHVGTLALNSIRPVGLEAVMRYLRWIKISSKDSQVDAKSLPDAFNLLSQHLDPKLDNSVAVREMYGMQFGLLAWLDKPWWQQQLAALFPTDKTLRYLDRSAWNSYLSFNPPYTDMLQAMRFRYERAINALQYTTTEVTDVLRSLGNHVMQLYAAGIIELDDPLMLSFFTKASPAFKSQTIGDIGWHLGQEDSDTLSPQLQERFMALWERRLSVGLADAKSSREELSSFGWWFGSKKFPDEWSIQQLIIVLEKFRRINPDFLVVKRLAELSSQYPYEAVLGLGIIFEEDRDGWAIYGWEGSAQMIVTEALKGNERSRAEAHRVVNLLVARGHRGFRDLLKQ